MLVISPGALLFVFRRVFVRRGLLRCQVSPLPLRRRCFTAAFSCFLFHFCVGSFLIFLSSFVFASVFYGCFCVRSFLFCFFLHSFILYSFKFVRFCIRLLRLLLRSFLPFAFVFVRGTFAFKSTILFFLFSFI